MSKQRIEHDQHDAILMSLSAIALMASTQYGIWKNYAALANRATKNDDLDHFKRCAERQSRVLRTTCEKMNEVMEYLGEVTNGHDCADEHEMTDAAFDAMHRALGKSESEADDEQN